MHVMTGDILECVCMVCASLVGWLTVLIPAYAKYHSVFQNGRDLQRKCKQNMLLVEYKTAHVLSLVYKDHVRGILG